MSCFVADICVGIRIEDPERNIHALDLVDMVLILKRLGKQLFTTVMLIQRYLCCFFIQLEGNHIIRL